MAHIVSIYSMLPFIAGRIKEFCLDLYLKSDIPIPPSKVVFLPNRC
jgi:hypothetical protein